MEVTIELTEEQLEEIKKQTINKMIEDLKEENKRLQKDYIDNNNELLKYFSPKQRKEYLKDSQCRCCRARGSMLYDGKLKCFKGDLSRYGEIVEENGVYGILMCGNFEWD